MLKKCRIFLFLFVFIIIIAGCHSNGNTESTNGDAKNDRQDDHVKTGDEQILVKPNNMLGFKLLEQVEPEEGNIFISPMSAMIAMLLVYNGADGETKREMTDALHIHDFNSDEVNGAISALMNVLDKKDEDVTLSIANSIWLNNQFQFHNDYKKSAEQYFAAKLETINMKDDASVDQMNDWVSEATNDKITDMVEKPLKQNFVAMILNAIYFNGKWKHAFDEANTTDSIFYMKDNEVTVPFMTLDEELLYAENDLFQAVQLPYGTGEMNVQLFLPNEEVGLEGFQEQLTEENWTTWNSEFSYTSGVIKLPKFQVEYETSLNEAFQQLGMKRAFDHMKAELPFIIEEDEQIVIDEIKQKTFIDVTEEGTEAAGATSVEIVLTSAVVDEENFHMEINRPFFFTITDEETNAILFMGVIQNPKQG